MAKDARLYARFTLDFTEHPKIAILSPTAFKTLVDAVLFSRRQLTDGFLARRLALARWSLEDLLELCTNDDANPSLIERPEGWYIHDYASQQDTKADIEARSERAKTAGQKGGLAKAKRTAKRTAKQKASKPLSKTLSKNVAETETETSTYVSSNVALGGGSGGNPSTRGIRLPREWRPPADVIASMAAQFPAVDLHAEHAKFCDYWHAKTGANATKRDWPATWRNWIRRAAEQTRATTNGQPMTRTDQRVAELQLRNAQERAAQAHDRKELTL